MTAALDEAQSAQLYAALAHDEIVARCVSKDRTIRSMRTLLADLVGKLRDAERRREIERARI